MNDARSIPEVPTGVLVLTAGVDVGEKMLAYEVVGWSFPSTGKWGTNAWV
jgi:phage terminase large subunit GpA-like protein